MDRLGPRKVVPIGAAAVGIGALLFATGNTDARQRRALHAGRGRRVRARRRGLHRHARTFPPSRAATLIGATQMFGMAGGSAGQFVVGPMIAGGLPWNAFWVGMGVVGLAIARAAVRAAAAEAERPRSDSRDWLASALARARRPCSAIRSRSCAG